MKKNKFRKILSLALASVMTLGMFTASATSVSAAGAEDPVTEIGVTKTVTVAKKGTLLPTETFTITMVPATAEQVKDATDSNGQQVEVGPALVEDTIEFNFDATDNTSLGKVSKSDVFSLTFEGGDEAFDHTGVYRYYVTEVGAVDENGDKVQNGYIDYDTSVYVVDLYVVQNSKGEYVVSNSCVTVEGKDTKPESITFTNAINCSDLKIYKDVEGTEYQQGEFYTFRILIPVGGTTITLEDGQKLQAQIYDGGGLVNDDRSDENGIVELTVAGEDLDADMETYATEFKLKNGEYLEILGAPVTMVYKVAEVTDTEEFQKEGYTVSYLYEEYGANNTGTVTVGDAQEVEGNVVQGTINTKSNEVTFINTREIEVPNSGISVDLLPYALVLLVALCGGILLIVSKKRRTN